MRVGIFVDAGYFFSRCALVATDRVVDRDDMQLDLDALLAELNNVRMTHAVSQLLRIYWYDAAKLGQMSAQQLMLARHDNIKVRLGTLTMDNRQKGVDSLIVTDLTELARNHAIVDAIVLSGDEDVRIGVQIAQTFGVRVHLLGIGTPGKSQSHQLMWEADTTTHWMADTIAKFMTFPKQEKRQLAALRQETGPGEHKATPAPLPIGALEQVVANVVGNMSASDLSDAVRALEIDVVPNETDRTLLKSSQGVVGRPLEHGEKTALRQIFKEEIRKLESSVAAPLPAGE
jgi:uncharacterized LabA/DUF88 family protein